MKKTPKIKLINSELSINCKNSEVVGLAYDIEKGLDIKYEVNPGKLCKIRFESPIIGFRMLDEGDLLEFWDSDYKGFGIYEVTKGGWASLEKSRSGFITGHHKFKEYLITGINDCVSVLVDLSNEPGIEIVT